MVGMGELAVLVLVGLGELAVLVTVLECLGNHCY